MSLGRNSLCPCGSGKKYKKCCLMKPNNNQHHLQSLVAKPVDLHQQSASQKPADGSNEKKVNTSVENLSKGGKVDYSSTDKFILLDKNTAVEAISKLEIEDLHFLNKLIVDRLKHLVNCKQNVEISKFYPGCRVRFTTKVGELKTGTVIRVNQKTISVEVDGEIGYWKVSPLLLEKIG